MTIEEQYTLAKDTLNGRLFAPYQREGVLWMLTMEGQKSGPKGGFLCDEMGLGKTVQLVATMLGNPKHLTQIYYHSMGRRNCAIRSELDDQYL
jgi:SNF2 family DNA or RNA helicase